MTPSKKGGEMIPERIYDILLNTRTADKITIRFKDGRIIQGALIFNHLKGTGRLINIERETSIDFAVDEIRDLKLQPAAKRSAPIPAEALLATQGSVEPEVDPDTNSDAGSDSETEADSEAAAPAAAKNGVASKNGVSSNGVSSNGVSSNGVATKTTSGKADASKKVIKEPAAN